MPSDRMPEPSESSMPPEPSAPRSPSRARARALHRSRRRRRIGLLVGLVVVALALAGAGGALVLGSRDDSPTASTAPTSDPGGEPAESPGTAPPPTSSPDARLTIGYGGDVLMHMPVMEDTEGGQGDIAPLTTAARPWTSGADLALCGMEVPISPTGVATGYPAFGTLPGVVTALANSGWDGCATASNHAWDQGVGGVTATADTLQAAGLGWSGTNRTQAEADAPYQIYELQREGRTIAVAQLSTTYGLNGFTADPSWSVNVNDVDWIARQARAAREAGADIVVLHSQIGEEYTPDPVAAQTEYARAIAATGEIDVLFSAHPHVPQTNELLSGGPNGEGMWVSYSAGNFISNQSIAQGTVLAGVGTFVWIDVTVRQSADGARDAHVDALHWHPFTVDNDGGHRMIDLAAAQAGDIPEGCTLSPQEITSRWEAVTSTLNMETYSETPPTMTGPEPTVVPRG